MPTTPANLSRTRRGLIIGFCCLSVLIVSIDATIVNVGLPSIQRGLHASISGLQWVADAYTLVLASLLMLTGSLADRFGRRRVFQTGMVLFTFGSLLCSLAPTLSTLVAARVIQATGASALNPVALAIISHAVRDRRERAAATGIWSGVAGLGLAVGPICGGVLIAAVGWRAIFWFNVPIGMIAIIGTQLVAPESRAAKPRRLDPAGQVLIIGLIGGLTAGIIEGGRSGWTSPIAVILFALAVVSAVGFVVVERRVSEPLLELRFFASAPFSGATINAIAAFCALGGFLFLNTLYLQDARGYSPLHAGLLTVPMAACMAIVAPLSGRIVAARGPRLPFVIAGICGIIGPLMLIGLRIDEPIGLLIAAYVVFGISMGMVNAPIATTAVSGMPPDQTGVAAAVASAGRQLGSALGVAITGAFVAGSTGGAIASSSHPAWGVLAGCGAIVLACGLISTGKWARSTIINFDVPASAEFTTADARETPDRRPARA
jgi:EmrB/QacA subfamily drug resistance transporter